jgi:hypothetical protein
MERIGSKKILVLYHFVTCLGSSSSEPGVIFRRFLMKLKYACGEMALLPTVPSHLMECFTDYLEKLSVARVEEGGMAVIIIDGADLIKECEHSLYWLLQPLPNNIRVVLSANEENYPDSWRTLPSPCIPTPTAQEMQDIVEFVVGDREALTMEQVGTLAVEGPSVPLWGVLATRHALSVRAESSNVMDDIIDSLITQQVRTVFFVLVTMIGKRNTSTLSPFSVCSGGRRPNMLHFEGTRRKLSVDGTQHRTGAKGYLLVQKWSSFQRTS